MTIQQQYQWSMEQNLPVQTTNFLCWPLLEPSFCEGTIFVSLNLSRTEVISIQVWKKNFELSITIFIPINLNVVRLLDKNAYIYIVYVYLEDRKLPPDLDCPFICQKHQILLTSDKAQMQRGNLSNKVKFQVMQGNKNYKKDSFLLPPLYLICLTLSVAI